MTESDFVIVERRAGFGPATRLDDRLLRIARNYVLFRPEGAGTFIAIDPPVVAFWHPYPPRL